MGILFRFYCKQILVGVCVLCVHTAMHIFYLLKIRRATLHTYDC